MDFKSKTVEDFLTWLENKGYDEWIREVFEENEVDGRAFLLLTKKHMKELVPRVGPRVKLIDDQAMLRQMNSEATVRHLTKHHTKHSWSEELNGDHDYNGDDHDDIDDYHIHHGVDHMDYHDIDVADHHCDVFDDHDHDDVNEDHDAVTDDRDDVANDHDDVANDHDDVANDHDDVADDHDDVADDHGVVADHHYNVDDHYHGGDVEHDRDGHNHKVDDGHNQDKMDDHNDGGDVDYDYDHNVDNHDIRIAEQTIMLHNDDSKDQQLQQINAVGLNFPKDSHMLTAEEPSKLFSEACQKIITDLVKDFRQDDNDSPIYSSDRSTDEDFNATAFPSDTSSDDVGQLKKRSKKKLKGTTKIHRKASVDSDAGCCTESDEGLLAGHRTAMPLPVKKIPRLHHKASAVSSGTRWSNKYSETSMTDHHKITNFKKTKKLQRKDTRKKKRSPLPRPFNLPKHFPKFVKRELSTGVLSGKARTRLIFTVANAVFEYTHYPTREEYDHVARQIVRKYDFMSDDRGSHEYIISVLEDKLMYLRNCTSRQAYKGPASRKRSSFVFTPRPPELRPPADYNDSLATYEMNLRMLQVEERKPNPNRETVMSLMEKTFFIRRQNILKAPTSVSSLLETFPSLRNYIQIIAEFNRIMGKDVHAIYCDCWKTLMQNVLAVAANETANAPIQTAIKVAGHRLSDGHKSILALYCLCYLLRQVDQKLDHQCIMTFIPENADVRMAAHGIITEGPSIIVRGNITQVKDAFLVIDKQFICKLPSMTEAVLILLACFYVFNKTHEEGFSNLFIFLEYSILGHSIPNKKTRVHNFLAQLAHVNDRNHV